MAAKLAGLDPECKDEDGQTAFECSIQEPGEDDYIVEAFMKNGFSLPLNALELAVDSCGLNQENASKVELLLKSNASLNLIYPDGHNVLHTCALRGAAQAAHAVLNHTGGVSFLNAQDAYGDTPLHSTVAGENVALARIFFEAGADINALNHNRLSALGSAIIAKSADLASYLLEQNPDIWLRRSGWTGCSILALAVAKDPLSKSIMPFLLSADIVDDDDDDEDADSDKHRFPQLHDPMVLNAVEIEHGNTVLHRAASLADYESVVSLMSAGASAKIINSRGLTAKQEAERELRCLQAVEGDREEEALREQNLRKIIGFLR